MICGVDEAGRGSAMGPLVVGAVYAESDTDFKRIGVKDSKKLSPKVREKMYDEIVSSCSDYCTVAISAEDIDERRKKQSLNTIEADMFLEATTKIPVTIIYADCPERNESGFSAALTAKTNQTKVIAEHKADDTYPIVSAASIIAKVTRDRMMDDIRKEFDANIGSGYPSDHFTMEFIEKWIKDNGVPPNHTRCSWEPVRKMISLSKITRIDDW